MATMLESEAQAVAHLTALVEAMPLPSLVADERCDIVAANAEARALLEQCGFQAGLTYCDLWPEAGGAGRCVAARAIARQRPTQGIGRHPRDERVVLRQYARPLALEGGRVVAVVSVVPSAGEDHAQAAALANLAVVCLDFERGDLPKAVVETLAEAAAMEGCAVWLGEEIGPLPATLSYFERDAANGWRRSTAPPGLETILRRAARQSQPVVAALPPGNSEAGDAAAAPRHVVATPLREDGHVLGVIAAINQRLDGWRDLTLRTMSAAGRLLAGALRARRAWEAARQEAVELAESNQRLVELHQLKTEFVSVVSHELRTPLTGVSTHVWTLTEYWDRLSDAQRLASLQAVSRRVQQLERLIADLLTLSRIEAGRPIEVTPQPLDLGPVIRQVCADLAESDGIGRVVVDVPEALPLVLADRSRTEEVLANLIDNGLKFSPGDRPVVVRTAVTEAEVIVHVVDRGRGIRPEDASRLFQPYVRLRDEDGSTVPGTGIGLYLSHKFVEAQGGRIFVESEYGKGSTFSFALPRVIREGGHQSPTS